MDVEQACHGNKTPEREFVTTAGKDDTIEANWK
jgi:hypothetical protein